MADIVSKYLTNPELIFEGFFRQVSSYSVFQNKTEFKVKVLTPPVAYTGPDSNVASANAETSAKYWFKGRIIDPNMPHEKFLPDPCDETIAANEAAAAALISLHSTVYMDEQPDFGVGSIITAFIEPGANNNKYDLQFMRYLKTDFKTPVNTDPALECVSLADIDFSESTLSGELGDNQATNFTVADRGPEDIKYIVLHSTAGASGDGKAQKTIDRFADDVVTISYTLRDGTGNYTGPSKKHPTCKEFRDETGLTLDLTPHHDLYCNTGRDSNDGSGIVETVVHTSIHYATDQGGNIVQGVLDKDIAYHAGVYNDVSIGIEMTGNPIDPGGVGKGYSNIYHEMYDNNILDTTAKLVAQLCLEYKIPPVWVENKSPDKNGNGGIIGHDQIKDDRYDPGARQDSVYGDRTGQPIPESRRNNLPEGRYWDWDNFISRVEAYYNGGRTSGATQTSQGELPTAGGQF